MQRGTLLNQPTSPPWVQENARNLAILSRVMAATALLAAGAWLFDLYRTLAAPGYGGQTVDIDFTVFWAAARLALEQGWLAPFDNSLLDDMRGLPPEAADFNMLWAYPPGYLILLLPFGMLPFFWAWLSFALISAVALAVALGPLARAIPGARVFVLAAPSTMITMAIGQNSLLTAALLVGALEALRRDRSILAGLLIACLTLKPQLGVMIPIALVASGRVRTILWAAVGTALLILLTTSVVGVDYWPAFKSSMGAIAAYMREGRFEQNVVISGYGAAIALGAQHVTALIVQVVLSLGVAIGLFWLWRQRAVCFDLKASGLCFAVLLAAPYAIYYELVFAVVGGVYFACGDRRGGLASRLLLVGLWMTPLAGLALLPEPGMAILAPLPLTGFLMCLRAAATAAE